MLTLDTDNHMTQKKRRRCRRTWNDNNSSHGPLHQMILKGDLKIAYELRRQDAKKKIKKNR